MRRRLAHLAIGASALLAIVALLGFVVAPAVIKAQLETRLAQALQRQVTVERVRVNPFTLSGAVQGFVMRERDSEQPLLTFDELFVDASMASLYRLSPVLDRVRLRQPHLRLVRLAEHRYNVQDLIEAALQPSSGPPPRFSLNNIEVQDGRIDFDDRPLGRRHEVTGIALGIPFISNLPYAVDIDVEPSLAAAVNGSPLRLKGDTKPFKDTRETALALDFDRIDLPTYVAYSPLPLPVQLRGGELDTRLTLRFVAGADNTPRTLSLAGTVELRQLRLSDGTSEPLLELPRAQVELTQFDAVANALAIGTIAVEAPLLHLRRNRDGSTNLDALRTPAGTRADPGGPPLRFDIAKVSLRDGRILFSDRQPEQRPFETDIRKLTVEAANLSNAP